MAEQVKAVVRLADPAQAGPALEQELIDYVKSRIARFEAPRSVDFVEELPRGAGEVLAGVRGRHRLRACHAARRSSDPCGYGSDAFGS